MLPKPATPPLELSSPRPVVLLDIDGVINVFQCSHARDVVVAPYLPTLKLLPDLSAALALLNTHATIVWCSTWGQLVNLDAATVWGLGARPIIEPTPEEAPQRDWKALAVRRTFSRWPGRIVWVEDGFRPAARSWASQRLAAGAPTRLVDVTDSGLTLPIAEDIADWIQQ
ncbi:MAG: hypothetical protein H0T53_07820 [Herpetosiphonaceae bacterium]|nr:hypothetical protein [Herpetosiphonaceae bacterium]